jgi:hypothetical protein
MDLDIALRNHFPEVNDKVQTPNYFVPHANHAPNIVHEELAQY